MQRTADAVALQVADDAKTPARGDGFDGAADAAEQFACPQLGDGGMGALA